MLINGPFKNDYTPTYSTEVETLVNDLYQDEISPKSTELTLTKMIDLIQIAEQEFEFYRKELQGGSHLRSLQHYIIGVFLIYLIIPNSIQFQIKNKNYEVFLTLKQLYDRETGMANVKLQAITYISYLKSKETNKEHSLKTKVRSNTLPSITPQQEISNHLTPPTLDPGRTFNDNSSALSIVSSVSTNSSIVDDLWLPPELQPKDELKLVNEVDSNDEEDINFRLQTEDHRIITTQSSLPSDNLKDLSVITPKLHHAYSFPVNQLNPVAENQGTSENNSLISSGNQNIRSYLLHRKESYRDGSVHSIYASEQDEEIPSVSSQWLFKSLSEIKYSFLIIDIRPLDKFKINHIPYANILNIDPSLVSNSDDFQELEDILRNSSLSEEFLKFKNIKRFDQVIIYTDLQSSVMYDTDYVSKFVHLLDERYIKSKILSGGFDSWLKYLSRNQKNKHILNFTVKSPFSAPEIVTASQIPSIPPPSLPNSPSPNQELPYDYSKLLPQYSIPSQVQLNNTASRITERPPIPNTVPIISPSRSNGLNQTHQLQQSSTQSSNSYYQYNRPVEPVPLHPSSSYLQQYPWQQNYTKQVQYEQSPLLQPPQYNNNDLAQHHYLQTSHKSEVGKSFDHPLGRQRINSDSIPTIQGSSLPFVRLSITGLRNMGNTCYINSMVQCLFASTKFRDIFLENKFEEYFNPKFTKPRLSSSLSILFKKMYLNGGCSIVPSAFLKSCIAMRPDLKIPLEQQDTQEFLMFMFDQLHEELSNSNAVVSDYPHLIQHESLGKEYDIWFEDLIKQGFSPISNFFQGQLQDSLQCMKCGFTSSNYSTFCMLSLVIPKTSISGKKLKKIQLEDCIQLFTHDEILSGDNAWDCPKCSKNKQTDNKSSSVSSQAQEKDTRKHRLHFGSNFFRSSRSSSPAPSKKSKKSQHPQLVDQEAKRSLKKSTVKSLKFVVLPPILIIHLSRFLFYDTSQKDDAIVQYPLLLSIPHGGQTIKYKLFGAINHYGTLKSGHYTAITNKNLNHDLNEPDWYYFDDEVVKATNHGSFSEKDQAHMSSSDVYVLFYERID
ncbi:hypothetical protein WICMUC_000707 [Wickerhamomyces mucosus]|uniref:ubiquitinyl hydrolase 1 n=1 Tax=Wickerhamomyces mucosus TaxID=1378264 RepID=A0A9P8PZ94_9ASCO|nr:hypothetical protein WICMUC_000707 [Wickerhamomyces mucosus]